MEEEPGRWIRPYYYDDYNMVEKLGSGIFYQDCYFSNNIGAQELQPNEVDVPIQSWDDQDQYQLYHEALQWMGYTSDEIDGLCMKTEQYSVQKGIETFGEKGKESAMKEIRNLAAKNSCFEELNYDSLTEEQKSRALPMLMFMVMKRNGIIKTRGVVNGKNQRIYHDRNEFTSPTPDFYAVKHVCAVAAKEERDVGTLDLLSFFLQTEAKEEHEMIVVKFTGALALLLVECDDKWRKHLRRENGKWVMHAKCSKIMHRTINAALKACKKLARHLKKWKFVMNPYDPCAWNAVVSGTQLTLLFHIDDALLTHKLSTEVTRQIKLLDA